MALVDATQLSPGEKVRLRVTLEDPAAARWGFNLTARTTANTNNPAGTFTITDAANTRLGPGGGSLPFVTHTLAGTRPGTSTFLNLGGRVDRTRVGGSVTFFVAGNAANNDDDAGNGDRIYTSTLAVDSATAVTTTPKVLSQFVFGGGFYTAIYLHNTGASATPVNVSFFGNDGTPLNVPSLGGTATTANVPAGGVALLEAPNNGALQQGWAKIDLPDGVIGYGVFRQSVAGRADQEAVVPFSDAASFQRNAHLRRRRTHNRGCRRQPNDERGDRDFDGEVELRHPSRLFVDQHSLSGQNRLHPRQQHCCGHRPARFRQLCRLQWGS